MLDSKSGTQLNYYRAVTNPNYDSLEMMETLRQSTIPSKLGALINRSQSRIVPSRWDSMDRCSRKGSVSRVGGHDRADSCNAQPGGNANKSKVSLKNLQNDSRRQINNYSSSVTKIGLKKPACTSTGH